MVVLLLTASAAFGATAIVVSEHPASQLRVSPGGGGTAGSLICSTSFFT